jgi:hypothetical protein
MALGTLVTNLNPLSAILIPGGQGREHAPQNAGRRSGRRDDYN